MAKKFFKYPKIYSFEHTMEEIREDNKRRLEPTERYMFTPSVKLHGTNAALVFKRGEEKPYYQSRERIITPDNDNNGFAKAMEEIFSDPQSTQLKQFREDLEYWFDIDPDTEYVVYYGEWCGNKIQKGVAISQIPNRILVLFEVHQYDKNGYLIYPMTLSQPVEILLQSPSDTIIYQGMIYGDEYGIEINPYKPEEYLSLLEQWTQTVEDSCPYAASLFNINGTGEGLVWTAYDSYRNDFYRFKTKGEKHRNAKPRVKIPKDSNSTTSEEEILSFVDSICLTPRYEQGITKLQEKGLPLDVSSTSEYIKWVVKDTLEEEGKQIGEFREETNLTQKVVTSALARKAKDYFFTFLKNPV